MKRFYTFNYIQKNIMGDVFQPDFSIYIVYVVKNEEKKHSLLDTIFFIVLFQKKLPRLLLEGGH